MNDPSLKPDMPGMSLDRARSLLGSQAENMTDAQVRALVHAMDVLADIVLDQIKRDRKAKRQAGPPGCPGT